MSGGRYVTDDETCAHGGALQVLWHLRRCLAAHSAAALGIVVRTEGSTYRKPGALILIEAGCLPYGVVSGGCLEEELRQAGERAIADGVPAIHQLDTRNPDDEIFGSGSGCRGHTFVLLLPTTAPGSRQACELIAAALSDQDAVTITTVLSGNHWAASLAVTGGRRLQFGSLSGGIEFERLMDERGSPGILVAECHLRAPPRLLIIGASPESEPLSRIALLMGWSVFVTDHRSQRIERFGVAVDRLLVCFPERAVDEFELQESDAAVVMTHSISRDLEALKALAKTVVGYVGMPGPRARRYELLDRLDAETRTSLAHRLRAPVGKNLGGHGPESLGLAISAELQEYFCASASERPPHWRSA